MVNFSCFEDVFAFALLLPMKRNEKRLFSADSFASGSGRDGTEARGPVDMSRAFDTRAKMTYADGSATHAVA